MKHRVLANFPGVFVALAIDADDTKIRQSDKRFLDRLAKSVSEFQKKERHQNATSSSRPTSQR